MNKLEKTFVPHQKLHASELNEMVETINGSIDDINQVSGKEDALASSVIKQIYLGTVSYNPSNNVVTLPAYPTSLPASDVYEWAKAASKPAYSYSEIQNAPAALADLADDATHRLVTDEDKAAWNGVVGIVPSAAYNIGNELADKAYVNNKIQTASADFKGTYVASADTEEAAQTALSSVSGMDNNDYAYVQIPNTPKKGVDKFKRYKYNGSAWAYEYTINTSSFDTAQWAAINSGLAEADKTKIDGIAVGAQVNIIEGIKVNGSTVTPDNKIVDITVPVVYDWAKASSKPTYTYSEIQNTPSIPDETTVAGWGFTKNAGTVTGVKMGSTTYEPVNGIVELPASPSPSADIEVVEFSGATLTCQAGKLYRATADVTTLAITLPTVTGSVAKNVILHIKTGANPAITFTNGNVGYFDSYAIAGEKEYEINAMYNGANWIVGCQEFESPSVEPLTLTVNEGSGKFGLVLPQGLYDSNGDPAIDYVEWSTDGVTWNKTNYDVDNGNAIETSELQQGDSVYFRGSARTFAATDGTTIYNSVFKCGGGSSGSESGSESGSSSGSGPTITDWSVSGNIMSLLGTDTLSQDESYQFYSLFSYCTTLTDASNLLLPATTLASYCCYAMFQGCLSLTTAPALPATTLAENCYQYMFQDCLGLTTAPELPATTLASNCYDGIFYGCTSLTTAPELPATTLAEDCYSYMFQGCIGLTTAPELPATTLVSNCYSNIFSGCTSLTTAPELPATTLAEGCYNCMFQGCTSLTTAPELPATTLAEGCYSSMFNGCTSLTTAPELPATTLVNQCYSGMFRSCSSLATAPELPATTLAEYCYQNMFYGCTSLTTAPELPATTLAMYCYSNMFNGCTSLTTAPALPATTLVIHCYDGMFYGCTSLTTVPALPATTLSTYCYSGMFNGCTSLTTAPALPATTLVNSCYQGMFNGCTGLTTVPALPATTLVEDCYQYMFIGCTSLTKITMLATYISALNCLSNWVSGVAATGTFIKNPAMTTLPTGSSGIPSGWTVQDYTPSV